LTRTIWSIKLLAPFERGADGEAPPRQVKPARRLVVPIRHHSTTPRARLGLDRRGKLAAAARATKEGLDKKHSILRDGDFTFLRGNAKTPYNGDSWTMLHPMRRERLESEGARVPLLEPGVARIVLEIA